MTPLSPADTQAELARHDAYRAELQRERLMVASAMLHAIIDYGNAIADGDVAARDAALARYQETLERVLDDSFGVRS